MMHEFLTEFFCLLGD